MMELQDIKLTVVNQDGGTMAVVTPGDSDAEDMAHLFRTIMFWLTFSPETIDEFIVPVDGWPDRDDIDEPEETEENKDER